jgi:hypothetical protein
MAARAHSSMAANLSRGSVNPRGRPAEDVVVCEGRIVLTAGDVTVSPEVGIEGLSEHSHLPGMIRKAGLEWAARREDGQGAIHSPFLQYHPATADTSPVRLTAGQGVRSGSLWTASGAHNSPGRGRSFRCGRITA